MHVNFVTLAGELGSAYMSLHLLCSAIGPKLPKPENVANKWYPAAYAAINWFAWGNGLKDNNNGKPTV